MQLKLHSYHIAGPTGIKHPTIRQANRTPLIIFLLTRLKLQMLWRRILLGIFPTRILRNLTVVSVPPPTPIKSAITSTSAIEPGHPHPSHPYRLGRNQKRHPHPHPLHHPLPTLDPFLSLTVPEKLQLIEDIWDSVVIYAEEIPLSQSHKQELDRRRSSYQNLENQGDNWENVKKRILKNDL